MNTGPTRASLETLHPALWRASQLAQAPAPVVPTGHGALDAVLPGGGWPLGGLVEFCLAQPGIGEIRLLQPALAALGPGPVVLAQPPCPPCAAAWPPRLASPCLWLRPRRPADALWAAEQVLRSRAFTALLIWQQSISFQALRRLQLAAQAGRTLCVLYRPWRACPQSSPAPLRLALQPMPDGLSLQVLKRRGHPHPQPILLRLETHGLTLHHALDSAASAAFRARRTGSALAH